MKKTGKTTEKQIHEEMIRRGFSPRFEPDNIDVMATCDMVTFDIEGKPYYASLTNTGRIKRNSMRLNNF